KLAGYAKKETGRTWLTATAWSGPAGRINQAQRSRTDTPGVLGAGRVAGTCGYISGPRRDRAGGRPGRDGRHDGGGAAPPDGTREHLPAGEDRRRSHQLLPLREPLRTARTRPALAG